MTRNELIATFKGALRPDYTKFSLSEANEAVIKGIVETYGLQDANARDIRAIVERPISNCGYTRWNNNCC